MANHILLCNDERRFRLMLSCLPPDKDWRTIVVVNDRNWKTVGTALQVAVARDYPRYVDSFEFESDSFALSDLEQAVFHRKPRSKYAQTGFDRYKLMVKIAIPFYYWHSKRPIVYTDDDVLVLRDPSKLCAGHVRGAPRLSIAKDSEWEELITSREIFRRHWPKWPLGENAASIRGAPLASPKAFHVHSFNAGVVTWNEMPSGWRQSYAASLFDYLDDAWLGMKMAKRRDTWWKRQLDERFFALTAAFAGGRVDHLNYGECDLFEMTFAKSAGQLSKLLRNIESGKAPTTVHFCGTTTKEQFLSFAESEIVPRVREAHRQGALV